MVLYEDHFEQVCAISRIKTDFRPYLLRRKPQDGRYSYSKNAAIESATADLLSRRAFVMEKGNLTVNSGGYRV